MSARAGCARRLVSPFLPTLSHHCRTKLKNKNTTIATMDSENLQQLVLQRRWDDVEARVKTHPEELKLTNIDSLNVLHLACCGNAPSATLRTMLRQDASSGHDVVLMTECYGRNPLMYVCDGRGPVSLVKDFVECAPHCVSVTEDGGWTPLHFLCVNTREHSDLTRSMAELLLKADKSMVYAMDIYGQTPLKLLCDQFESLAAAQAAGQAGDSDVFQQYQDEFFQLYQEDPRSATGFAREIEYFWSFACALVQSHCPLPPKTPILHQFCSFPRCPDMLLSFALKAYPDQVTKCDLDGNTPFHLAVLQRDSDLMLRLLACGTDALRIRNNQGHLPISLAFREPWSQIHLMLLQHHPGGLEAAGFADSLYPQLVSGSSVTPNTIFGILRSKPVLSQR